MANWYGNVVRSTTTSGYEQISAMRSEAAQTATPMRWADRAHQVLQPACGRLGAAPIRLHDLRHGASSLALEADVDIKVVQELLGHSSSVLTRDTYTSVSPRLAKEAAERTAAMVPRRNAKAG